MTNLEYEQMAGLVRRCVREEITRAIEHGANRAGIEDGPRPNPFTRAGQKVAETPPTSDTESDATSSAASDDTSATAHQ